jgi:hypothetical protein
VGGCVCVYVCVCVCVNSGIRDTIINSNLNKRDCPASDPGRSLSHITHCTVGCVLHCRHSVYVAYKRIHAPNRNGSSNFAASIQPFIKYTIWDYKNILILCI